MPTLRTYTKEVYSLDEVKEKALEKNWDINVDYEWWDCTYEDAQTIFELIGFTFHDEKQPFYFSGFSSQGDGACIDKASYRYQKGALKAVKDYAPQDTDLHFIAKALQDMQRKAFYTGTASIRHSGHYYHERSMAIDSECEKGMFDESDFSELVSDLCKWLYRNLEKEYDYLTSEEVILETLQANEYEFDASGNII